jgi:hypothetical protein
MADAALPLCPKLYTITLFVQPCFCERVDVFLRLLKCLCVELSVYSFDKLSVVSQVAITSLSLSFLVALLFALCLTV